MKFVLFNCLMAAVLFFLHTKGVLLVAWENDVLFIIPSIIFIFLVGNLSVYLEHPFREWCFDAMLGLGLLGTFYGIYLAFNGIDVSVLGDVEGMVQQAGNVIQAIGVAIWTSMVGLFFNLWLNANEKMLHKR